MKHLFLLFTSMYRESIYRKELYVYYSDLQIANSLLIKIYQSYNHYSLFKHIKNSLKILFKHGKRTFKEIPSITIGCFPLVIRFEMNFLYMMVAYYNYFYQQIPSVLEFCYLMAIEYKRKPDTRWSTRVFFFFGSKTETMIKF